VKYPYVERGLTLRFIGCIFFYFNYIIEFRLPQTGKNKRRKMKKKRRREQESIKTSAKKSKADDD